MATITHDILPLVSLRVRDAAISDVLRSVGTFLIAASLTVFLFNDDYANPALLVTAWAFLIAGFAFSEKREVSNFRKGAIILLIASAWVAVPLSAWMDTGPTGLNMSIAIWLSPLALLTFIKAPTSIFQWLIPLALINSGAIIYAGLFHRDVRPSGFIDSPNPAAGLLLLISIYCLYSPRLKWLAIPMIAAIIYTGSRLALVVLVFILAYMLLTRFPSRVFLILAVGVAALVVVPSISIVADSYRISYLPSLIRQSDGERVSISKRLTIERNVNGIPSGIVDRGEGPVHNVPLRIAMEFGIPAAVAWVLLSMAGLQRKRRPLLLMFLAVLLIGMLDYYVWIGPMGAWYWLLLGMENPKYRIWKQYDAEGKITGIIHEPT